jgi:uncharacterized protein (TIGR02217 family)
MGASFHEVQFPVGIAMGFSGGPGWKTTVMTLASGYEKRNMDWSVSRAVYDCAQGLKTQTELDTLLNFFYARRGKAFGFRFKDWADFQLPFPGSALPTLFTTNGGSTTTFQLVKVYGDSANTYTRTISKPVAGTLLLYDNGVTTSSFTVNTTTGIVTLTGSLATSSGHVVTGQCEFDVPVRFEVDDLKAQMKDYNVFDWGAIQLVEVRDI